MKQLTDRQLVERAFEFGDWAFLKLQPYKQKSVAMWHNMKLASRYYGPFQILQKLGTVAYKLNLPPTSKIHHVFHVSALKQKLGQHISHLPTLPPIDTEGTILLPKPEQIIDRRLKFCYGVLVRKCAMVCLDKHYSSSCLTSSCSGLCLKGTTNSVVRCRELK